MRPGPDRIEPGRSPGGIVVQIYTAGEELLSTTNLGPDDDANARAVADANAVAVFGPQPIVVVVFDGDTGERFNPRDYRRLLR